MPKIISRSKDKTNLGIAIFSTILTFIPVLIVLFTGTSSFKTNYGIYAL